MIEFSAKEEVSSENSLIRVFLDYKGVEAASSELPRRISMKLNEIISRYFVDEKIKESAANFLNEFFYFKCTDFPNFFFVECESATGNFHGEIVITSKKLDVIWGLGSRKIIHHISHFIKAAISDFSDSVKFRELSVESVKTVCNEYRAVNNNEFCEIISSGDISENSVKLMSNFFDDLSIGKKILSGKDIFPVFGEGKSKGDVFPELVSCCIECMKNFDISVSCIYYGRDNEDGEEIDFENLVEHFSHGEGFYGIDSGELIENFDFNMLGVSIHLNK